MKCFVPRCKHNIKLNPEKLFIRVPNKPNIRMKWYQAVGVSGNPNTQSKQVCCEDHFELELDAKNWQFYKAIGQRILLKDGVIPHKYVSDSPPAVTTSQLTDSARKRKFDTLGGIEETPKNVKRVFFEGTSRKEMVMEGKISETTSTDQGVQVEFIKPTSSVATSPLKTVGTQSIEKTYSFLSISSDHSEYEPSSSSTSYDTAEIKNERRLLSTMNVVEQNSKFYLGLPQDVYNIVKLITNHAKVTHKDVFILLKKLKLDDTYTRLAIDFDMSTSNVQRIFTQTIPKMANLLQNLIFFPPEGLTKKTLPIPFRLRYNKVQSIIDCLEIQIEKPSDPVNQSLTWSEYKKCNTIKYLISCTPHGFINFISQGYGGRTTDKEIVIHSQYIENLPRNSSVMADRGFKHIALLLAQKKCNLVRPPSVTVGEKSSPDEIKESKRIASLRIHVERVIERLRRFQMLGPHACIDHQLLYLMDYLLIIACGIVNIQGPLIK